MTVVPTIHEIRRYPVKSMGGESLASVEIDGRGLVGDRWYAVVDGDGKLSSGKHSNRFRRRDAVFDFASRTTDDGVRVSGRGGEWGAGSPDLDDALSDGDGRPGPGPRRGRDTAPGRRRGVAGRHRVARLVPRAPRRRRGPSTPPAQPRGRHQRALRRGDVVGRAVRWAARACGWSGASTAAGWSTSPRRGCRREGGWLKALTDTREMCLAVYLDVDAPGRRPRRRRGRRGLNRTCQDGKRE